MTHLFPGWLALSVSEFINYTLSFCAASLIVFVLIAGIASYLRFERMTKPVSCEEDEVPPGDMLQHQILQRLGSGTKTPDPFGLVLIRAPESSEEGLLQQAQGIIEKHVRQEDVLQIREEGTLAVLLGAPGRQLEGVVRRMAQTEDLLKVMPSMQLSSVSYPENGSSYAVLLEEVHQGFNQLEASANRYWRAPLGEDAGEVTRNLSDMLDPLTGVLKPDRIVSSLQKIVSRHRKEEKPLSLIYLDVDTLERYNRHYGREGGDAILKQLGAFIESGFRETDLVGRYEGEEFLAAVSCPADRALLAARRFAAEVKKNPFEFNGMKLKITVSVGVAGFPEHGLVPRQLFDAASAALSTAKNRGPGRVVLYEGGATFPADLENKAEGI